LSDPPLAEGPEPPLLKDRRPRALRGHAQRPGNFRGRRPSMMAKELRGLRWSSTPTKPDHDGKPDCRPPNLQHRVHVSFLTKAHDDARPWRSHNPEMGSIAASGRNPVNFPPGRREGQTHSLGSRNRAAERTTHLRLLPALGRRQGLGRRAETATKQLLLTGRDVTGLPNRHVNENGKWGPLPRAHSRTCRVHSGYFPDQVRVARLQPMPRNPTRSNEWST